MRVVRRSCAIVPLRYTIAYERAAASPMLCTVVRSASQLHRTLVKDNSPAQTLRDLFRSTAFNRRPLFAS